MDLIRLTAEAVSRLLLSDLKACIQSPKKIVYEHQKHLHRPYDGHNRCLRTKRQHHS